MKTTFTEADRAALQARNEERSAAERVRMGSRWLLHTDNRIVKKTSFTTKLGQKTLAFT